jgi:AcrR family transcriptional regulator
MSELETVGGATERRGKRRGRRQEVMDAATRLFYEKGYDATSTQDIGDLVGMLKGSLYYYVDSKEDFLFQIVLETHQGALELIDVVRTSGGSALDRLVRLIHSHIAYYTANLEKSVVFFREFRHLSDERKAVINREGDAYLKFVRQLLNEAKKDGSLAATLDVRLASLAVVGMLNSLHQWYRPRGKAKPEEIAGQFTSMLVTGMISDTAVQQAGGLGPLRDACTRGVLTPE